MGKAAMLLPKGPHPPPPTYHLWAFSVTPGIYRSTLFLNNLEPSLNVSFSLCHSVWSHALVSAASENSLSISHPSPATSPFVCFLLQNRFPERVAHGPCLTSPLSLLSPASFPAPPETVGGRVSSALLVTRSRSCLYPLPLDLSQRLTQLSILPSMNSWLLRYLLPHWPFCLSPLLAPLLGDHQTSVSSGFLLRLFCSPSLGVLISMP